ncbi:MAG: UDP-N-acetylmuramoyl-L-alanyl-D-glutamate--2,6-diaminopimelate ligase [Gemmatimonadaceae bacterium]
MPLDPQLIADSLDSAGLLVERRGALPSTLTGLVDDSRAVTPGACFVALAGTDHDGHAFIPQALRAGASLVIAETAAAVAGAPAALLVRDGRRAAAVAATAAFGWPARDLILAGVTGTNGKTTTVNLLRHLLHGDDTPTASIGTLGVLMGSAGEELRGGSGLTTPGPIELQRVLRALVDRGVRVIAMEASSHAIDQRRIDGVEFDVAVFTNLTRDHLDYHGTMERYFASKSRLLEYLKPHGVAVVNADDPAWYRLRTDRRRVGYSTRVHAEVHASDVRFGPQGSEWTLGLADERFPVRLPLIGDFNVANAIAAAAAAYALGVRGEVIAERLASVPQVPGRLERIATDPTVLRDYAHTPDALERAIAAVRPFTRGRLIVVFGAGGDRDRGKRPEMGAIAARDADVAIVTSDNPRTEDPQRILDDIVAGMGAGATPERIEDRREAIARALAIARPGDVVLLAGKGHETYQIRGTEKLPFDERQVVAELLAAAGR